MGRWRKTWIDVYRGKRGTTHRVCFYDSQTRARRVARTFKTKHLAKAFANELEAYLNGHGPKPGTPTSPRSSSRPQPRLWSVTASQWVESGAIREKTKRDYTLVLERFAKQMGVICVEDVTEATVSDFLAKVKTKGRSLATCATYLRILAAFFSWARPGDSPVTQKLIGRWGPYKKRKRARPHYFTEREYASLIAAAGTIKANKEGQRCKVWWRTFLSVLYHGGLRLSEATHLIWRDIDFEKGIIRIQPHVGLEGVFDWHPKGKARRAVPVPAESMAYLVEMQSKQSEGLPYVFLPESRYQVLTGNGGPGQQLLYDLDKGFTKIRDIAGIAEGTIHDLRRTCITNWAKNPHLAPKDVQILAGHQDLNTTLDVYAMVEEDDVVEKMIRLRDRQATDKASNRSSKTSSS